MKANSRKLLWFSIILASYFLALYLIWHYEINITIIGVLQELLTIPMIIGLPVLLFFIGRSLVSKQGRTTANILALILSSATTILIFQSF